MAYENGTDDIASVVATSTGLAFVSYPNAISKFDAVPQLFAVLFFLMLFLLGIGSNVGIHTCVFTVIKDRFSNISTWKIVIPLSIAQFFIGLMYVTPVRPFRSLIFAMKSVKSLSRVVNIYLDS